MIVRLTRLFDSVKQTLFILGTALIGFLALRNSLVWHMQQIWGASGDFWHHYWQVLYNGFGGNDILITCIGTWAYTFAVFWVANLLFLVLDLTGCPAALLKYKVQEEKKATKSDVLRAARVAMFNQTVVTPPFLLAVYLAFQWRGCSVSPADLPAFHWVVFEMMIFLLVEELGFYYTHRLFHHPSLYKHIHKKHHEWTASIGLVSIYAHPIEHVLSNMLPPVLGPLLMGSHLASTWLFFTIVLLSTTVAHSGYHLPFLPSPEAHDFHHLKFNQNYGVLGVLDRLHGTDIMFRNSLAYKRHFLMLSLVPVSQQFPDPPKQRKMAEKTE